MSVADAESMRGVGLGPPGRYWEGTQIAPAIKRLIEIVVAAMVLLLLAPLVGLVALAIVLESPTGSVTRSSLSARRREPGGTGS